MATDTLGNEIGKLFVGGLQQTTTNDTLKTYFSKYGEVEDAIVMMDNNTQRSRGFGYVKFVDSLAVENTLKSGPHVLDNKEIDPKPCNVNMKGKNRRSLKVFVGGIAPEVNEEIVREFFSQYGNVTDINLMIDPTKQRHRGFAFVGLDDEEVVKRLIAQHYVNIGGKQVEIKAMEPPNSRRNANALASGVMNMNMGMPGAVGMMGNQQGGGRNNGSRGGGGGGLQNPHHHQQANRYMTPAQQNAVAAAQQIPQFLFNTGPTNPNDYHQFNSLTAAAAVGQHPNAVGAAGPFSNSSMLGAATPYSNLWNAAAAANSAGSQNLVNNWNANAAGLGSLNLSSMSALTNGSGAPGNAGAGNPANGGATSMHMWPGAAATTDNRFGGVPTSMMSGVNTNNGHQVGNNSMGAGGNAGGNAGNHHNPHGHPHHQTSGHGSQQQGPQQGQGGNPGGPGAGSSSLNWNDYLASFGMLSSAPGMDATGNSGVNMSGHQSNAIPVSAGPQNPSQWNMWNENHRHAAAMQNNNPGGVGGGPPGNTQQGPPNQGFNSSMPSSFGQNNVGPSAGGVAQNGPNNGQDWRSAAVTANGPTGNPMGGNPLQHSGLAAATAAAFNR